MINIILADDHKLFRETLAVLLGSDDRFRVIASCGDSLEAIGSIQREKPDIVLMDIDIRPISGIEATEKICAVTAARVIGLSMHNHPSYVKKMMRAGAMGYVTKNSSKTEIFTAIVEVNKGNKFICQETKTMFAEAVLEGNVAPPHAGLLTERELEIVNYIKKGLSSREIAGRISVALKTVEVCRHSILKKLKLNNSCSLVEFMNHNTGFLV